MRQQFYLCQGTEYVHVRLRAKIDWLVINGTSTHAERSLCANCGGRKPTQSAKNGQQDTMNAYKTSHYTITMQHSSQQYTPVTRTHQLSNRIWLTCLLCQIAGKPVNILMYADDLVLRGSSWHAKQSLLSTCARAVTDIRMSFNTSKSYTMIL